MIKEQSGYLLGVHQEQPRLATIFSSQDRWLMGHIGLALHFQNLTGSSAEGLSAASFTRNVTKYGITSKNTATAFLNEMTQYGVISQKPHPNDRRMRVITPAPATLEAISGWIGLHLRTLDTLDGRERVAWFQASLPSSLAFLQPEIANGLLHDDTIRNPHHAFAHFMWMNSGFLVTERLVASLEGDLETGARLPTSLVSAAELTAGFNLSRSHSARKINQAEELGILGWSGTKGRSTMWVSREFVSSFLDLQAAKLAIIDRVVAAHSLAVPLKQLDRA